MKKITTIFLFIILVFISSQEIVIAQNIDRVRIKYADKLVLPHGLKGFFDYKQALAYAKKVNEPIFIYFTGHGCVNCREMENTVWSNKEVLKKLRNNFVIAALYVDERTRLPKEEWYRSDFDRSIVKTVGDLNADLQITKFNNNAQPYYCLVNLKEELLVESKSFDRNIKRFIVFLDTASDNFKKRKSQKNRN